MFPLKSWFPYNRPDRPNRPSRLKIGSGDPGDCMETLQKRFLHANTFTPLLESI